MSDFPVKRPYPLEWIIKQRQIDEAVLHFMDSNKPFSSDKSKSITILQDMRRESMFVFTGLPEFIHDNSTIQQSYYRLNEQRKYNPDVIYSLFCTELPTTQWIEIIGKLGNVNRIIFPNMYNSIFPKKGIQSSQVQVDAVVKIREEAAKYGIHIINLDYSRSRSQFFIPISSYDYETTPMLFDAMKRLTLDALKIPRYPQEMLDTLLWYPPMSNKREKNVNLVPSGESYWSPNQNKAKEHKKILGFLPELRSIVIEYKKEKRI